MKMLNQFNFLLGQVKAGYSLKKTQATTTTIKMKLKLKTTIDKRKENWADGK